MEISKQVAPTPRKVLTRKPKARFKSYPGSIYLQGHCNRLYISYKGIRRATGLTDTRENRRVAEELLWEMYRAYNGLPSLRPRDDMNGVVEKKETTLFMAKKEWENHLDHTDRSEKTLKAYKDSTKRILTKDGPIDEETIESQVRTWIGKTRDHYSPTSTNIHLRNFSVFLTWLHKKKYLTDVVDLSPFRRKGGGKPVRVYTDKQCDLIIKYFEKKAAAAVKKVEKRQRESAAEFALLIRFLLATGARINEALKLRRSDMVDGNLVLPNKIERKVEYFPISKDVAKILSELPQDRENIFRWSYSSTSSLNRELHAALEKLKIESMGGFHVFRKTFQDRLKRAGVDMADRQKLLRHRNIKTTIDSYTYSDTDRLKRVLNNIK